MKVSVRHSKEWIIVGSAERNTAWLGKEIAR